MCLMCFARQFRLVGMSSCLDESRSCSGVDPGGRLVNGFDNRFCHLVAIDVAQGPGVEEFCVRLSRCSGDSACGCFRK
jgi:hypothetical protein